MTKYTLGAKASKITETEEYDVERSMGGVYQNHWLAVGALAEISFDDLEVAIHMADCRRAAINFGFDWKDITGPSRERRFVDFRKLCSQHLRNNSWTYKQIGIFLGDRDHATAMHSYKSAEHLVKYDRDFRQQRKKFYTS